MEFIYRFIYICCIMLTSFVSAAAQVSYTNDNSAVSQGTVQLSVENDSMAINEEKHDSIIFSIITCTPGADVYAKFGHTALRMKNITTREDVVFNYGCFNYNSDNFLFKFILGQTDYLLEAEPTESFMYRYGAMGNGVVEQIVNLTDVEALELRRKLLENLLPENQEYRYKWIGNNCTDKAKYMIESVVRGKVKYDYSNIENDPTVRDILHQCLENTPWVSFGIDLLLGHEIDNGFSFFKKNNTEESHKWKMFIPARFSEAANQATILRNGNNAVPYVKSENQIITASFEENMPNIFTPITVFACILAFVLFISFVDVKRKVLSMWLDITLLVAQGLTGLIIAFLFFFSEHPAVDSNWLVILFNPIPLIYALWLYISYKKGIKNMLAYVNLALLTLFFVTMPICPQSFNVATYLLVLTLLVRAYVNCKLCKQNRPYGV